MRPKGRLTAERKGFRDLAIYSLNHRSVGKSTHAPGTAGAHVAYITRENAAGAVLAERMPQERNEARAWINQAEAHDRKNGRICDKVMVALPRELDVEQRVELKTVSTAILGKISPSRRASLRPRFQRGRIVMKSTTTAAAVAALMLIATQGANASELTWQQCIQDFKFYSSAARTCKNMNARVVEGDKCRMSGVCQNSYGIPRDTSITVPRGRVRKLNNCNGWLRDGSC